MVYNFYFLNSVILSKSQRESEFLYSFVWFECKQMAKEESFEWIIYPGLLCERIKETTPWRIHQSFPLRSILFNMLFDYSLTLLIIKLLTTHWAFIMISYCTHFLMKVMPVDSIAVWRSTTSLSSDPSSISLFQVAWDISPFHEKLIGHCPGPH